MRLLNVHSLQFQFFDDGKRPRYAIASHRWRDGTEASLKDVQKNRNTGSHGYKKVKRFSAFVRDYIPEVEWLWIDTCCIDKSNSQELQEAITAMYKWYEEAAVCLAYLEDVDKPHAQGDNNDNSDDGDWHQFRRSVWFTRGWTLQELLAPRLVVFLSAGWNVIGHKCQDSYEYPSLSLLAGPRINGLIKDVTNIPEAVIAQPELRRALSLEQKFGWMAGRTTTRAEDIAYCLLGIFGVSMPLIYNEGKAAAHRRLMRAIKEASEEVLPSTLPSSSTSAGILNSGKYEGERRNTSLCDVHLSESFGLYSEQAETPPLPASTVPFLRDPDFIDRPEMGILEQKLSVSGTRVALLGLGGIGKSQLAIEYCYRVRERTASTWVLWVHASSAARFEESIRKCAEDMKIAGRKEAKADIYRLMHDWLRDERRGRWVLVLDSLDEADFVFEAPNLSESTSYTGSERNVSSRTRLDYLPICTHGSILVTSRNRAVVEKIVDDCNVVTVQPMDKGIALSLLEKKLGRQDGMSSLHTLAATLDYMPLAIAQAAAYIKKRAPRLTVEQYLDRFEKSERTRMSLLDKNLVDLRRYREASSSNSIMLTWQISFEHIYRSRRSAANLLSLMAFFDHRSIPESLLRPEYDDDEIGNPNNGSKFDNENDVDGESSHASSDTSNVDCFEDDIMVLRDYLFINVLSKNEFAMHRLIQLAARKWLKSQEQYQEWTERSIRRLNLSFPLGEYEDWETCRALYPHARAIYELKAESRTACLDQASVLHKAAQYGLQQGLLKEAEIFVLCARDINSKIFGNEDGATLNNVVLLATTLLDQGKYQASEEMYRQALNGYQNLYGSNHLVTLKCVSYLSEAVRSQGSYKAAEEMSRQAWEGREKLLGKEHPYTLFSAGRLASALQDQGEYERAEKIFRWVFETEEIVLGEEHPNTLIACNNLALVLQDQDRYEAAAEMFERAIRVEEKVFGKGHPNTLDTISNLALVLRSQGKYELAAEMYHRVIERQEEVLGKEHPSTLGSLQGLARTLEYQGKAHEAEETHWRVLTGYEKAFGKESQHPAVMVCVTDLAILLQRHGKYEAAKEMYQRALEGLEKVLGKEHLNTIMTALHLGTLYHEQQSHSAAMDMYKQVYSRLVKVLGPSHKTTVFCAQRLSELRSEADTEPASQHLTSSPAPASLATTKPTADSESESSRPPS